MTGDAKRKASEPRAHHFVPQFYLAGFTDTGTREGRLTVFGLGRQRAREWSVTPKELGHERDFYRDDSSDDDPTWFERDLLGAHETAVGALLRRLTENPVLPPIDSEDGQLLMTFVALMFARVPVLLENIGKPLTDIGQTILEMMTLDRERFEAIIADAKARGTIDPNEEVDYEAFRADIEQGHFRLSVTRSYLLGRILYIADLVAPLLRGRRWMLLVNECPDASFLVSDHPVAVTFSEPQVRSALDLPAFGRRDTDVTMPLTKSLALLGRIEDGESRTIKADCGMVAAVNAKTMAYARRFTAGPSKCAFLFPDEQGALFGYDELRQRFERTKERAGDAETDA